jgi:hypothetical protein
MERRMPSSNLPFALTDLELPPKRPARGHQPQAEPPAHQTGATGGSAGSTAP